MSSSRPSGLWLISLAAFCSMASMRVCDPMLVELSSQFGVSVGEASAVISAFAVAYGCLQLFYGPLGDRVGKLRVINLAVLACAVFSALTATADNLDQSRVVTLLYFTTRFAISLLKTAIDSLSST